MLSICTVTFWLAKHFLHHDTVEGEGGEGLWSQRGASPCPGLYL